MNNLAVIIGITCLVLQSTLASNCDNTYPYSLDVGFYWAKVTNPLTLEFEMVKSCADNVTTTAAFIPNKKTVLWVHGLQPGYVQQGIRFGQETEGMDDVFRVWLMKGYNVGIFQWTQFADEIVPNFERAEAKIWSGKFFNHMEYLHIQTGSESLHRAEASPSRSVSDYFVDLYMAHFADFAAGTEIRVVGHSLGCQLAVVSVHKLFEENAPLPTRVALLDPVFSPNGRPFLWLNECGSNVPTAIGCYCGQLGAAGVAVEMYKSSFINNCLFTRDDESMLIQNVAYARVKLNRDGAMSMGDCYDERLFSSSGLKHILKTMARQTQYQHSYIIPYYSLSLLMPPARCVYDKEKKTCVPNSQLALSAAMKASDVVMWARTEFEEYGRGCFVQFDSGKSTHDHDPSNDVYYITSCDKMNL